MPLDTPLLMTPPVYQSILEWSLHADRPMWQRDCLRRIIQGLAIDAAALDELEAICIGSPSYTASALAKSHLPSYSASGESVTLHSLAELSNVNQLPGDGISFGKGSGLSIVYGENGSGKSGYARVIKKACHTRGNKPDIQGNVYSASSPAKPAAKIHYAVKDSPACCSWQDGSAADSILSSVFVFDSESAKHYLNENGPTCFTPLGLHILVTLAQVADKLDGRLQAKVSGLEEKNALVSKAWKFPPDTRVAKLLQSLSHSTSTAHIEKLAIFGDTETAQLNEITQALNEDPLAKSRATKAAANRIRNFITTIVTRVATLNDSKLEELRISLQTLHAMEGLMSVVQPKSFDESFLHGTGNVEWQEFWQSAKKFAIDFAYQDQAYPSAVDQACVLCQRPIDDAVTLERMQRFDSFVQNHAASKYHAASEGWTKLSSSFNTLVPASSSLQSIEADISNLALEVKDGLDAFIKSIDARLQGVKVSIKSEQWTPPTPCVPFPKDRLDGFTTALDQRAEMEASLVKPEEVEKRKAEKAELEAHAWLNKHKDQIVDQIERYKKIQTLKMVMKSTKTQAISKKNGEIANAAITDTFIRSFESEAIALQIKTIPTKIEKIGTRKGELEYGIRLVSTSRAALKDVASEGEQRAISLAAFFAELQIAPHKSTVVFDDPVSSLDYNRRRYVAKRLIEEGKVRQVIVFTHDTMFLMDLLFQAKEQSIPTYKRHLYWDDKLPGKCSEEFPWEAKNYKAQLNELEQKCRMLRTQWNPQPSPSNCQDMQELYTFLRGTIELIAQDVLVGQVVHRLKREVEISNLKNLESLTDLEFRLFQQLHNKASNTFYGHLRELSEIPGVPTPDELLNDLQALQKAVKEIIERRNRRLTPAPLAATA